MAIFHGTTIPAGASGDPEFTGSGESLKFNSASNAFLNHTAANFQPTSPYTISCWVKRCKLGANGYVYRINSADSLYFNTSDQIGLERRPTSFTTARKFRDVSNWYHIVVKSTSSDVTLYINGVQEQTASGTANPYTAGRFDIGCANGNTQYFDGYISQFHYVQGQALGPESFGEEGTYGEWKVKEYTGGHGSTGFYLSFSKPGFVYETGDRRSSITVTSSLSAISGSAWQNMVDGDLSAGSASNSAWWTNGVSVVGEWLKFDLGSNRVITSARYHQDEGNTSAHQGQWKWQGSTDNSSWTDIGSQFQFGGSLIQIQTQLHGNTTAYRYYRLLGISGTTVYNYQVEMEFGTGTLSTNGLGTDDSGNGNHFTVNNITTSDQMLDTPLNNYCTFNSLEDNPYHAGHFGEGNLEGAGKTSSYFHMGSVGTLYTTKKFYFEVYLQNQSNPDVFFGVAPDEYHPSTSPSNDAVNNWPGKNFAGASVNCSYDVVRWDKNQSYSFTTTASSGDIWGVAFDPATGKFWVHQNGTWFSSGNPSTGANPLCTLSDLAIGSQSRLWTCAAGQYQLQSRMILNCGQDGTFNGNKTAQGYKDENDEGNFYYAVPTGFLALCENNLDDPAVKPAEHFSVTLRSGNGNQAVTGIGFQPDLIWSKTRNQTHNWQVHDSVRGPTAGMLSTDIPDAESSTYTLDSFDSDGFTIDSGNLVGMNNSGNNYVTYAWKAGTTTSGTTTGSGTGQSYSASYNTDAGFSIVKYDGNGTAGHTIPHHLSKAPTLVMVKRRNNGNNWAVGQAVHSSYGWNGAMKLDYHEVWSGDNRWNNTAPTNTVFTVSSDVSTNTSGGTYVAYCYHDVDGYSRIGTYNATYQTNGPFIYTGFRPAYILTKGMNYATWWCIYDTKRSIDNPTDELLNAQVNNTEYGPGADTFKLDILSNGFKLREQDSYSNASGTHYMYMAFAEQPFKYSNAR